MTVQLITRDQPINVETSFDEWIAGFTPSRADGHAFYAFSTSGMQQIFDAIRGAGSKRPIGFKRAR